MFCVRFTGRSSRPSLTGFSLSVCMGAFSFLAPFASPLPLPLRWLVLARPVSPPAVSCLLALVSRSASLRSPASLAPRAPPASALLSSVSWRLWAWATSSVCNLNLLPTPQSSLPPSYSRSTFQRARHVGQQERKEDCGVGREDTARPASRSSPLPKPPSARSTWGRGASAREREHVLAQARGLRSMFGCELRLRHTRRGRFGARAGRWRHLSVAGLAVATKYFSGGAVKKELSCAPYTCQRHLLGILTQCPSTAGGTQICLLCCQPVPVPRSLAARVSPLTRGDPCRPPAWPG
jgi:hypothetical protein